MMLKKLLQDFASDIERIAQQDKPSPIELLFIANALNNLAQAAGEEKFVPTQHERASTPITCPK